MMHAIFHYAFLAYEVWVKKKRTKPKNNKKQSKTKKHKQKTKHKYRQMATFSMLLIFAISLKDPGSRALLTGPSTRCTSILNWIAEVSLGCSPAVFGSFLAKI